MFDPYSDLEPDTPHRPVNLWGCAIPVLLIVGGILCSYGFYHLVLWWRGLS